VGLFDTRDGAAQEASDFVARMLRRAAEKGTMSEADAEAAVGRLQIVNSLSEFASANVVVEAIVEDLDVKKSLFGELEGIVGPDCILASNTSSLSVTAIASGCGTPERVAGWHFFNPVPLLKVVEIVEGLLTAPWVSEALDGIARRCGHHPVRAQDTPGFLVNHAGRGLNTEGLRILQERIAGAQDIDEVLREGGTRFRMGPFELMDTTGLDVSGVVMESIYQQFYGGYYVYEDGKKVTAVPAPVPEVKPGTVWVSPAEPEGQSAVMAAISDVAEIEAGAKPGPESLCILTPIGADATTTALNQGLDPVRCVAIDTIFGLEGRRTLMTTPVTEPRWRDQAHAIFAADGTPVTVIQDSPGFIAQRVIATIVNIGCEIAQQGIATPEDINKAVELGLAYPRGPIAWGDHVGPARILAILEQLHAFYRDPRYRPSPWLIRRAQLGLPLTTRST
jgi:3-hydroxybutyryl-CoA dehydrogenase